MIIKVSSLIDVCFTCILELTFWIWIVLLVIELTICWLVCYYCSWASERLCCVFQCFVGRSPIWSVRFEWTLSSHFSTSSPPCLLLSHRQSLTQRPQVHLPYTVPFTLKTRLVCIVELNGWLWLQANRSKSKKEEIEHSIMIPSFGLVRNWSTDWSDFDSFITFRWHLQFCLNWRTWIVLFCFVNVVVAAAAAVVVVVVWVLNWIATFALAGIGCLMMFSGVPVYLIFVYWKNKPAFVQKALGNIFVQNTTNLIRMTMFKMPSSSELIRYCMLI